MNTRAQKNVIYISGNTVKLYRRNKSYRNTLPNDYQNKIYTPKPEFGLDLTNEQNKPLDDETDRRHYWFPPNFLQ